MARTLISVIGGHNPGPEDLLAAEEVGRGLARRGATVVCGGLDGVMSAVCKGARGEGGTTIGILPGRETSQANPYVDIPICTGMGYARNVIVVKSGGAVIAIDGAYGTLSEVGHALEDGIPVIGLNTWTLTIRGREDTLIERATGPDDAVERALRAAEARRAAVGA